jgi:murein L,D-transpeptidase YcbB/YkuD
VAHERQRAAGNDRADRSRGKARQTGETRPSAVQQQILSLHGAIGNAAVVKLMRASGGEASSKLARADEKWAPSDKWPTSEKWAPASEKLGPGWYSSKVAGPVGQTARPTLRMGSSGPLVVELQTFLGVPADGIFGKQTAKAVRAFQSAAGLTADGVVGPATWAVIRAGVPQGRPELFNAKLEPGTAGSVSKLSIEDRTAKLDLGSLAGDKYLGDPWQKL